MMFPKFQSFIANILPGWKTISLAGLMGGVNLLDWALMNFDNVIPGVSELLPEPYKTIFNVVVPALIMWLRNIKQRTDAAKAVATPATP